MTSEMKALWVALVAVAILALGAYAFPTTPGAEDSFGASTPGTRFPHGVTVGPVASSPTNLALIKAGTCTAAIATLPVAATSSQPATCTATGALAGDIVVVQLPQAGSAASSFGGFYVSGTSATTDSITFNIFNNAGASTSSFPLATTSVQYEIYRTQ